MRYYIVIAIRELILISVYISVYMRYYIVIAIRELVLIFWTIR